MEALALRSRAGPRLALPSSRERVVSTSPACIAPNLTVKVVVTANRPPPEGLTVPTIRKENVGCQPMSRKSFLAADKLATAV